MTRGPQRGALVFGGTSSGLGAVRSLGRRDIPAWILTRGSRTSWERLLASSSRYPKRVLPWPKGDDAEKVRYLLDLAEHHGLDGWALIPTGDEDASLLARHQAALGERYCLAVPSSESLQTAYDKRLTYRLADTLGVDYPWTHYPTGPEDVTALDCTFPAILKPAIKRGYNRFTGAKAWRVEDHAELQARYAEACTLTDPALIMIQELVPGGGEGQFSYAAICKDGRVLASLVARRTRQYPIDFGLNSTFVETVDEPGIEEPARRLLAALAYTGAIEVEFKRDPASGAYKLLDVNARLWAWHTLGERAGVDFTYLIWRLIHNLDIPETRARRGVRWVSLVGDLHAAASEIRRGRLTPSGYLRSLCGPLQPATFALDDPLPALVEGPLLWYLLSKRPGFSETAWLGGLWRGFTGTLHSPSRHVPA